MSDPLDLRDGPLEDYLLAWKKRAVSAHSHAYPDGFPPQRDLEASKGIVWARNSSSSGFPSIEDWVLASGLGVAIKGCSTKVMLAFGGGG